MIVYKPLLAYPYCKYSNKLNRKRNNTSFSIQNITTKAILKIATAAT